MFGISASCLSSSFSSIFNFWGITIIDVTDIISPSFVTHINLLRIKDIIT